MLDTPRLLLTEIGRSDLDDFSYLYADPEVGRFIGLDREVAA